MLGWNFYMMPELAARGLLMMTQFYNLDGTKKHNEDLELPYPDLSKFEIYKNVLQHSVSNNLTTQKNINHTIKIFENRNLMIESFPKNSVIAELGVFKGEFSKVIYDICKPSKLYLVDMFSGTVGSGDKDGENFQHAQLEDELVKIQDYFQDKNVDVLKSTTTDFLLSIEDESLDIVYIDADHSYRGVMTDLLLSWRKVKRNGLICGHDYVRDQYNHDAKIAIDDFCKTLGLEIQMLTQDGCPSFCIIKNKSIF
jgi:hypothetical protein